VTPMRSKRWDPANNNLDGLLFEGAPALLGQLDDLVLRPRSWWRETLLPIVYLVGEPTGGNPLDGLANRLRQARGVLHSRIDGRETPLADNGQSSVNSIHQLLDGAVADLSQRSGRGRPLRFPHYSLAVWLASLIANHTTSNQPDDPERRVNIALQEFIKERYQLQNRASSTEVSVANEIPWWFRIPILVLPPLGILLMRIFWRPPRWAARNRISSDHKCGSFRELARKFMEQGSGEHQHNVRPDEIDRLLVDAFMEDLRRGYRRTTLLGVGRRRTTYPVLLINKIGSTDSCLRLLEIISDSRTYYLRMNRKDTAGPGQQPREHAYFHPLLIIAQGDSSTLDRIGPNNHRPEKHEKYLIADVKYYYHEWYRALASSDRTWFLPLRVPIEHPPQRSSPGTPGLRTELTEIPLPAAPQPMMTFVVAVLLIIAASITICSNYTRCGTWYWEPQLQRTALTANRTQCVGLSSSRHRFFDALGDVNGVDQKLADDLKNAEAKIYETNDLAVEKPNYLTVVYLSQLSSTNPADYRSELEQLRGLTVAQKESLADRPIRILLANGGYQMNNAKKAAETIASEAKKDPTLVAVVGMGISREGTKDAMIRLAQPDTHIPMIGTVISATKLATKTTPYYHQVGPTNQREADIAAFYAATRLHARNVTIYYSGDNLDLYNKDLRDQAGPAFKAQRLDVSEQQYRINPGDDGDDINLVGREACNVGPEGVAFYAGRAEQFPVFLEGMRTACEGHYPQVLAGDSVTRFVLDGRLDEFPGLTVNYLSQASSLAWGPDCRGAINRVGFFVGYRKLFGDGACTSLRDGSSILAHDSLWAVTQGVRNTRVERPSPDAVLAGITNISGEGPGALHGASGTIDYPRTGDQAVPNDKTILILRGSALMAPQRMLLCGQLDTAQPPPDGDCPKQARP
jgi:ABC-type branched-subunit amino acid transport system substrate-binding protein